jgi:hypothetical protein
MALTDRKKGHVNSSWRAVMDLYPASGSGSVELPNTELGWGDNADSHGRFCAQCRFPLADTRKLKTCPNCGSDNFNGVKFAK